MLQQSGQVCPGMSDENPQQNLSGSAAEGWWLQVYVAPN